MPKIFIMFLAPFLLVAAVLVSPLACVYFLFDRLCDCIEEFKPTTGRRGRRKQPGMAKQLGRVINLIPTRGKAITNDNKGGHSTTQPAL